MEDDNIRPPDESFTDQLIEDTRSEFDKQIDKAMYLSIQELTAQQKVVNEYEKRLLDEYASENQRRKETFSDFLLNLNKIGKFDKEIREIYNIVEPIIETYCNQFIDTCELDKVTYDNIFNTLKKIRHNQSVLDKLKTIILSE